MPADALEIFELDGLIMNAVRALKSTQRSLDRRSPSYSIPRLAVEASFRMLNRQQHLWHRTHQEEHHVLRFELVAVPDPPDPTSIAIDPDLAQHPQADLLNHLARACNVACAELTQSQGPYYLLRGVEAALSGSGSAPVQYEMRICIRNGTLTLTQ